MGLITENNAQYYAGQQGFKVTDISAEGHNEFTWTGDVALTSSNFKVKVQGVEISTFTLTNNTVTVTSSLLNNDVVLIELKKNFVEDNYNGYEYVSLGNIINNFIVAYVGEGKLIPRVKRTDVMFHAKRGLQEFSYDTINSVKSQELTIPLSLSVVIPQDYVSLLAVSYIDELGVKRFIYSTDLTSSPTALPTQDLEGFFIQDDSGANVKASSSITEERFASANTNRIVGNTFVNSMTQSDAINSGIIGQRYGLNPRTTQKNGWYVINKREGKISFSSDLADKVVILEYTSDGLAYDADTKVPKMAEEAMYAHLSYSILAGRSNQQEYVIRRLKQEKTSKLRNAKIRLSNINLKDISQVMRNKSKWIKQ